MVDAPIPNPPDPGLSGSIFTSQRLTRILIALMTVVSCAIFIFGARAVHWPSERGFRGSLAQPPMALGPFIVALVLLGLCSLLGSWVLSRRWYLAGLMTASAGLTTWAIRGGGMTDVLFNANNSGMNGGVFLELIGELIVFYGVIGGIWNLIWARHQPSEIAEEKSQDEGRSSSGAIVAQTALMAVFMLILAHTSQKKQVLAAVFFSGVFATAIAEQFFADRKAGRWYWVGPLIAGCAGYIANYVSPIGLETGQVSGMFSPLGHVLPLDYASLGCAGVLLGYWWMTPEDDDMQDDEVMLVRRIMDANLGKRSVPKTDANRAEGDSAETA